MAPKCTGPYRCCSPMACTDWGYCRDRNVTAGGMKNVTPAMQAEWRVIDNPKEPVSAEG